MRYFLITLIAVAFYSCDKQTNPPVEESLIFGHFYGECMGETCVLTYKLTEAVLYRDTIQSYSGQNLSFVMMEQAQFDLVSNLLSNFPEELLDETETTIGCPDCLDQGGLFLEYSNGDLFGSWRIDQMQSAVPEYLHPFMDQVNASIALLN